MYAHMGVRSRPTWMPCLETITLRETATNKNDIFSQLSDGSSSSDE